MKNNGWKSYLCLEIVEEMNRFALLNFKIFSGQCPQPPYPQLRRPSPDPTPSALRRFAPPCLAAPSVVPPCVYILRYFRLCLVLL